MRRAGGQRWIGVVGLAAAVAVSVPSETEGQEAARAPNVVYVELFGNALYAGSVNYERMITPRLSARVGASPFGAFPLMLNSLHGRGEHSVELGLGVMLVASGERPSGTATLGYRYQPRGGGMVFRVGWTPLVGPEGIATWGGVSLGYAF